MPQHPGKSVLKGITTRKIDKSIDNKIKNRGNRGHGLSAIPDLDCKPDTLKTKQILHK